MRTAIVIAAAFLGFAGAASAEPAANPAASLNRAAVLVAKGEYADARAIYREIERTPADYRIETTDGRWVYPAEVARRGLVAIERRDRPVEIASRK